ncbi:hypothetical protein IPA_01130 [Ignicoccus pacificus DSM 13166]|uniref:Restriction endonuclease type IV Mrr domain-containing protein n=1 Tax=Ignicoccus pacificus DSM 13166 TaxID=940294 RepID=A0A977KAF4_9CREN|nr:hypothetical protein IPA_01130 [Ignicoccus pacificus DSM 13166]
MNLKDKVLLLLKEGCADPGPFRWLSAFDFIYESEGKICVDAKEDLALWAVLNNVLRESEAAPYLSWRAFESYVMKVFDSLGFETIHSLRVRIPGRMMEFDVVAYDGKKVIVVECKRWQRSSPSALRRIAEEHRAKVFKASEHLSKYGKVALPLVITLRGKPMFLDSIVVPIRYLKDLTEHLDQLFYEFEVVKLQQ